MTATPSLRLLEEPPGDHDRATVAALDFLVALGVDVDRIDVREGAAGLAALYRRLLTPEAFEVTTFENDVGYDELIVMRDIEFVSLCACHFVPYRGLAHVAYLPGERIVALSTLVRVVEHSARAVQSPERLVNRVADWLEAWLAPGGAGVVVEAEPCERSPDGGGRKSTAALRGRLRDDPATQREFLAVSGHATGRRQ